MHYTCEYTYHINCRCEHERYYKAAHYCNTLQHTATHCNTLHMNCRCEHELNYEAFKTRNSDSLSNLPPHAKVTGGYCHKELKVSVYVRMYVCMHVRVHLISMFVEYTRTCFRVQVCVNLIWLSIWYVCMFDYICICIYTHTHPRIYWYIYIHI